MAKRFFVFILLLLFCPLWINAETNKADVKVAFSRGGYLWVNTNGIEEKLTEEKAIYTNPPSWSFDGKMILYQKEGPGFFNEKEPSNELWVYSFETKKHKKIFFDGHNPKWSPTENIIAFTDGGVLNISDLKGFYNIALGVDDYEWQPNGKGFIASSSANLRPDGWTHPILYTISIEGGYREMGDLTKNVKKLFVIPKELENKGVKIISINAQSFTFSPNGQWISFIVSPTASWSMDSDLLCVISVDGKEFEVLDEVILEFHPQWAYTENILGYIAGGGRIVFGFKNKNLKVAEIPSGFKEQLTPDNFAEMGLTWVNDQSLIVSRVKETEWSNDPAMRPKPSLYYVTVTSQKQLKITTPPEGMGDFNPIYLPAINKISWLRKSDLVSDKVDLWKADSDGTKAEIWIHDIGGYSFFPKR